MEAKMIVKFLEPDKTELLRNMMNEDPEFKLAARFMSKDVRIGAGESACLIKVLDGIVKEIRLNPFLESWDFSFTGPLESWEKYFIPIPPPFYDNIFTGMTSQHFKLEGNVEAACAHYWALTRMIELIKQLQNA
jgi:hypothetical protein